MIDFLITHDTVQKGVLAETSIIGKNKAINTPLGVELIFDEIVMDTDREVFFKRYFQDGCAEIIKAIPMRYLKNTPTNIREAFEEYRDLSDADTERDFVLFLNVPSTFPMQYKTSIEVKLRQYLIDYVVWRWLETKLPEEALLYFARLAETIENIKSLITRNCAPYKRVPSFP